MNLKKIIRIMTGVFLSIIPICLSAQSVKAENGQFCRNNAYIYFNENAENVSGNMECITYINSSKYKLPKSTYKRNEYIFDGWNTKKDGSGIRYDDEDIIGKSDHYLILYAQWSLPEVSKFKVSSKNNALKLTWDETPGADSYYIYKTKNQKETECIKLSECSYIDKNVSKDCVYSYEILAENNGTVSKKSTVADGCLLEKPNISYLLQSSEESVFIRLADPLIETQKQKKDTQNQIGRK